MVKLSVMDIHSLSRFQLEHLIDEYPWFTIARKLYLQKLSNGNKEKILSFVKECSLHIPSKKEFIESVINSRGQEKIETEREPQIEVKETNIDEKPRQYIVGGDYFSRDDFKKLSEDGLSVNVNLHFSPEEGTEAQKDIVEVNNNLDLLSDYLYTETLAEIYTNQGLYPQAIEIYSKLILLYPEKSAYFASLIENIKNKIN